MDKKREEVLQQLKITRKTRGISYQDIVDATERMGMAVSLSSVKRVFSADSCADDFRYDTTIRPIVRFVLGIDEESEPTSSQNPEDVKHPPDTLTAAANCKDAIIEMLESELDRLRCDHRQMIKTITEIEGSNLDYLKKEVEIARAERDNKESQLNKFRKTTFLFLTTSLLFLSVILAALCIDCLNPAFGFFWLK